MNVFVNFPQLETDKEEFENKVSQFHATLLIEKIKEINVPDESKKDLFNLILKEVKEKCMNE